MPNKTGDALVPGARCAGSPTAPMLAPRAYRAVYKPARTPVATAEGQR